MQYLNMKQISNKEVCKLWFSTEDKYPVVKFIYNLHKETVDLIIDSMFYTPRDPWITNIPVYHFTVYHKNSITETEYYRFLNHIKSIYTKHDIEGFTYLAFFDTIKYYFRKRVPKSPIKKYLRRNLPKALISSVMIPEFKRKYLIPDIVTLENDDIQYLQYKDLINPDYIDGNRLTFLQKNTLFNIAYYDDSVFSSLKKVFHNSMNVMKNMTNNMAVNKKYKGVYLNNT